jgi:ABC-type uncharacterized transport system involved in gliding motility auxiliary subunit
MSNESPAGKQPSSSLFQQRGVAFGLQSLTITTLVLCLVGVANFVGTRYPLRKDLTKNRIHTLAEQTEKQVRELKEKTTFVLFAKANQREQHKRLLESLRDLNPKQLSLEYVDPDWEPIRAKEAGVKKAMTLVVTVGKRNQALEEITEEKILNSLIKLSREKSPLICALTGHGEKALNGQDAMGLELVRRGLTEQTYETKEFNLQLEPKVPDACDVVAIVGPTQAFLPKEIEGLSAYLENGGRALIALEPSAKGHDPAKDLAPVLEKWFVKPEAGMIVDPRAQIIGLVPLENLSKQSPITKEFRSQAIFVASRALTEVPGRPAGLSVQSLASSSKVSWSETNLTGLASGKLAYEAGQDTKGPLTTGYTIEGKLPNSKAVRNTRLVVLGSAQFAANQFARVAGNLDLVLNTLSWLAEDERLISIRPREDQPNLIANKSSTMALVFYLGWLGLPLLTLGAGLGVWWKRRRL